MDGMKGRNQNGWLVEGFETMDADTLMNKPFEKKQFLIEGLLPQGVSILCGASKSGKSWMMLDMALKIAAGQPMWDRETLKCDVLYLSLEDTYARLQDRLMKLTDEAPDNLRFGTMSSTLSEGLEKDISDYIYSYPKTKLIIIDTLQMIRSAADRSGSMYANDYAEIEVFKKIFAEKGVSTMVVHHLRKKKDGDDPINEVLGSTGIVGAVDSVYVLRKPKRQYNSSNLIVAGRDVQYQELALEFEDYRWVLIERPDQRELRVEETPPFLFSIRDYVIDKKEWSGTVTDLLAEVGEKETVPAAASKAIVKYYYEIFFPAGIDYHAKRTNKTRLLTLKIRDESDRSDASDRSDGKNDI